MATFENYLSRFDEKWILSQDGAQNQKDRRRAILQARENVANMPTNDYAWLFHHLKSAIAVDLYNSQPYETELRLKLTAYAIIHCLRDLRGNEATLAILAMKVTTFSNICLGGSVT